MVALLVLLGLVLSLVALLSVPVDLLQASRADETVTATGTVRRAFGLVSVRLRPPDRDEGEEGGEQMEDEQRGEREKRAKKRGGARFARRPASDAPVRSRLLRYVGDIVHAFRQAEGEVSV